jgi:hypothetical protein
MNLTSKMCALDSWAGADGHPGVLLPGAIPAPLLAAVPGRHPRRPHVQPVPGQPGGRPRLHHPGPAQQHRARQPGHAAPHARPHLLAPLTRAPLPSQVRGGRAEGEGRGRGGKD